MVSYKLESFDITHSVERYSAKKLEDLFESSEIVQNNLGEFMKFTWEDSSFPIDLKLFLTRKNLISNLKTVYYIGEHTEEYLFKRGIRNLIDLKAHLRYRHSANEVLNLIKNKDYFNLCKNKYINDIDVSFCFDSTDLLFVDIETLGIYDSPMIVVGVGYYEEGIFKIEILFARELEEEIAMCEYLKNVIFPRFKCFVSYNGKSFDIPYIANRFLYFFEENPLIFTDDVPYKQVNTKYHHIDLYHCCRKKYKGLFDNYTLTNMEIQLLNWVRRNELPSNLVGTCYKKYLKNPQRYIGLVKEIIDHNYYDIYALPLILKKIIED